MAKYPRSASFPKILLRGWRLRRALERNLARSHADYQSVLHNPNKTKQALLVATFELQGCHWALDQHKSRAILWKAEIIKRNRLGGEMTAKTARKPSFDGYRRKEDREYRTSFTTNGAKLGNGESELSHRFSQFWLACWV
jgi:hypothetical protein